MDTHLSLNSLLDYNLGDYGSFSYQEKTQKNEESSQFTVMTPSVALSSFQANVNGNASYPVLCRTASLISALNLFREGSPFQELQSEQTSCESSDHEYLEDNEKWKKKLEVYLIGREIVGQNLQKILKKNQEIQKELQDPSEANHVRVEVLSSQYLTAVYIPKNEFPDLNSNQITEIKACFMATILRNEMLNNSNDTSAIDYENFKIRLKEKYFDSTWQNVNPDEMTLLFRFERAILLLKKYIHGNANKRLFLSVGSLLELKADSNYYVIGGGSTSETKRRVSLYEHLCGLNPRKRNKTHPRLNQQKVTLPPKQDDLTYLKEDDVTYLIEEDKWKRRLIQRMTQCILTREIRDQVMNHIQEIQNQLYYLLDPIYEIKKIFQEFSSKKYFLSKYKNFSLENYQIKEIKACFLATILRHVILIELNKDTRSDREAFKSKVQNEYSEFIDLEQVADNSSELTFLFRFERAILLLKEYIYIKNNKSLFLSVGNLLEGCENWIYYVSGSGATPETQRRQGLAQYLCNVSLEKHNNLAHSNGSSVDFFDQDDDRDNHLPRKKSKKQA